MKDAMNSEEARIVEAARAARLKIQFEGVRAYTAGKSRRDNPYSPPDGAADFGQGRDWREGEWDAGWVDARIAATSTPDK